MSLPRPGSEQYMPTLIRTLLDNPALEEWQFDPNTFSLLLLSLIVKKGGVILDVPSASSSQSYETLGVVDEVIGICESIFGLDTRHIHFDPAMAPADIQQMIQEPDTGLRRHYRSRRSRQSRAQSRSRSGSGSRSRSHSQSHSRASSPRRPALNIITPESGVSTRYHSAETQLMGSRRSSYIIPASAYATPGTEMDDQESKAREEDERKTWPDVLVITGLEDCESPLWIKMCDLVKVSKMERGDGREMMVIWVRDEDKSELAPAWLVDNFVLSDSVELDDLDHVPDLPRQTLIPPEYVESLTALLPYTHIHAPITQHLNNLISATSTHPNLHSVMTAKFFTTLPILVKAHRLLSSPYRLPLDWYENLLRISQPGQGRTQRFGLGGGQGGVDDWPRKAGEEPNIGDLGAEAEEWFVVPANVRGIWGNAVRHRVKWRSGGESIMWTMRTSAAGLLKDLGDDHEAKRGKVKVKRRKQVNGIVEEMVEMV